MIDMKKIGIIITICILLLSTSTLVVASDWSNSWEFKYEEEPTKETIPERPPIKPQYDPQATFASYATLSFGGKANVTAYTPALSFTAYATLSFGGKVEVQAPASSTNVTINATTGIEETNATCHGYVIDNASSDTTCYFELDKESDSFTSPDVNVSAGVIAEGSGFNENITGLENGTLYYARINANNTEGWTTSYNTVHFLTKPQPATNIQITNISGGFNISWTHGDGYNSSFLVSNTYNYPTDRTNGTNIYVGPNDYYRDTDLDPATTYYYRVWERSNWSEPLEIQYSDGNESADKYYTGLQPVLSNPYPANESIDVSTSLTSWNITIESPMGATFNWSIQTSPDIGSNSANNANNGSKSATLSGLGPSITYTVFVNASETTNSQWSNETYWFTTENIIFTPYATLSFGGKAEVQGDEPVLSNEQPTNASTDIDMYPLLEITVNEPQDEKFNISWSTNATEIWVYYNSTCDDGTFSQRATFANASNTTYWWTVAVNDTTGHWTNKTYHFTTATYSWSDWSDWWEFTYTCCVGNNFEATGYNQTQVNLTWNNCTEDGCDTNVLVRNESGWAAYPLTPTNGTEIYNGTLEHYEDSPLSNGTTYYYTLWGWNSTGKEYSVINRTDTGSTQGDFEICWEYPVNLSTEISRPPVNISVQINGTGLDVYFYWYNMTPTIDVWELVTNWSEESTNRFNYTMLWSNGWVWGNTTYQWTVNVTNGETWINNSYQYNTTELANGADARYDVSNDDWVDGTDLIRDYVHRTGEATYDGIYDVNTPPDGWIDGTDLLIIYANRS